METLQTATKIITLLTQATTYRELQFAMKAAKGEGYKVDCKLNAKQEVLAAYRNTLVMEINAQIADLEVVENSQSNAAVVDDTPVLETEEIADTSTELERVTQVFAVAIASEGCPHDVSLEAAKALAAEVVDKQPRTTEEDMVIKQAWKAVQAAPTVDEPSYSAWTSPALVTVAKVKYGIEYACRRAAADTALLRDIASFGLEVIRFTLAG